MSKKDFTTLTREELIEGIVDMQDPEIAQHKRLQILVNYDNENGEPMHVLKIRDGKYFVAEFDWRYYNDEDTVQLKQEEVSRELFREYLYDSLKKCSLNELRAKYQVTKKDQMFIKKEERNKMKIDKLLHVAAAQQLELLKRITKVSHIPNDYTLVGKAKDKLCAQIIEEFNINPDISIWQDTTGDMILTVYASSDSRYIECLAVKDLGKEFIFDEESEESLKAIFSALTEPQNKE